MNTRQRKWFIFSACIALFISLQSCQKQARAAESLKQETALMALGRMDTMLSIFSPETGLTEAGCELFFIDRENRQPPRKEHFDPVAQTPARNFVQVFSLSAPPCTI